MSKRSSTVRPEPIPVNVVCSLCGEPWSLHTEVDGEVSMLECIRLLKARRTYYPQPYPIYPQRWYQLGQPYWATCISAGNTSPASYTVNASIEQRTPTVALASAST